MPFVASAQLAVGELGKVEIGTDPTIGDFVYDFEVDTITTVKIYGNGVYGANSRISFGDQASMFAMNAMVGEEASGDSDKLWLHGKNGLCITSAYAAQDTLFTYDVSNMGNAYFNCNLTARGLYVASDQRFKSNIAPLEHSLKSLANLDAVSYTLIPKYNGKSGKSLTPTTEKDKRDKARFDEYYANMQKNPEQRYGLIAQQVKEIYPELVKTDNNGMMYVDYVGLIPVLINAVNELNSKVETLNNENGELRLKNARQAVAGGMEVVSSEPKLYQNMPNPFSAETIINYELPSSAQNAQICVMDMTGAMKKQYDLTATGMSSITISASELSAGMYLYALIVDGKEIDCKRMILTK